MIVVVVVYMYICVLLISAFYMRGLFKLISLFITRVTLSYPIHSYRDVVDVGSSNVT